MNWIHLLPQVESAIDESPYSLEEVQDMLGYTDWYDRHLFADETWWFGYSKGKSELSFRQILDLLGDLMGLDKFMFADAFRLRLLSMVNEKIELENEPAIAYEALEEDAA